jgi:hypothetical protein
MGTAKLPPISEYKSELYNITEDYSEYNDLAASNPAKLKELQDLFLAEVKYQVSPWPTSQMCLFGAYRRKVEMLWIFSQLRIHGALAGVRRVDGKECTAATVSTLREQSCTERLPQPLLHHVNLACVESRVALVDTPEWQSHS